MLRIRFWLLIAALVLFTIGVYCLAPPVSTAFHAQWPLWPVAGFVALVLREIAKDEVVAAWRGRPRRVVVEKEVGAASLLVVVIVVVVILLLLGFFR
jgi:hypothetical protein